MKEKLIKSLIKDQSFAEYLITANLSECDMIKLVCHAPISLFEKQTLYKKLIEKKGCIRENCDDGFSYENYLKIATQAIEDLTISRGGIFLLVEHGFGDEHDEQFGCAPFKSFCAVQKYLKDFLHEGGEKNVWHTLEKWEPKSKDLLELVEVCEFTFIGAEPCFYKNLRYFYNKERYTKNRQQLHHENNFTLFSSGNNLNLPTPFRTGDVLHVDCRPFAPQTRVTVTDIRPEFDCCYPQCEYVDKNGEKKTGALKHSHIYKENVIESISPLYNLRWEKK